MTFQIGDRMIRNPTSMTVRLFLLVPLLLVTPALAFKPATKLSY